MDPRENSSAPPIEAATWLLLVAALGCWLVAPAVESSATLGRWLSVALVIFAWPRWQSQLLPRVLRAYADTHLAPPVPSLALVVLFLGLLFPLWTGEAPVSRDHAMHYFQSAQLVDAVRERGLAGGWTFWSGALNGGYRFGDTYPALGYLLTSALHLVSGGFVSLRASYALGMVGIWVLMTWAVRALAIRAMSEVEGRKHLREGARARNDIYTWAGFVAAAAFLLDPGASREGGWVYCMFHGVWPQMLATALWLCSLELSIRALRDGKLRALGLAALATGGALVAHPFAWICVSMSGLAFLVSALDCEGRRRGVLAWTVVVHGLAFGLAAGTVVRFDVAARALVRGPVPWESLRGLMGRLLEGSSFSAPTAIVGVGGLIGCGLLVRRAFAQRNPHRPRLAPIWGALMAMLLLCGSLEALTLLRLDLLLPGLKNLQFPRFAIALRPLWAVAAGVGVVWTVDRLRKALRSQHREGLSLTRSARVVAGLLCAPFVVASLESIAAGPAAPVGQPAVLWHRSDAAVELELRKVLSQLVESRQASGEGPVSVAFLRKGMSARTYPMFSIADAGARLILDAHVAGLNFRPEVQTQSADALRKLGVTHVLFDRPVEPSLLEDGEIIWRGGGWTLTTLARAQSRNQPWFELEASKTASLSWSRDGDGWVVNAEGGSGPLRVRAAISPYFRWTLRPQSGQRIELRPTELEPGLYGLEFELPGPGRYRLSQHELALEKRARIISWLSLLLCLSSLSSGRAWGGQERAGRPPWMRFGPQVLTFATVVFILAALMRQSLQTQVIWQAAYERAVDPQAGATTPLRFEPLDRDAFVLTKATLPACSRLDERDAQLGCRPSEHRDRPYILYRHPYVHRCWSIHLEAGDRRTLTLDNPNDLLVLVVSEEPLLELQHQGRALELRALDPIPQVLSTIDGAHQLELQNPTPSPQRVCIAAAEIVR